MNSVKTVGLFAQCVFGVLAQLLGKVLLGDIREFHVPGYARKTHQHAIYYERSLYNFPGI